MNINDIIYVHIPKAGGVSIQESLKELNYNLSYGHRTASEIKRVIGEQNFNNKFVFTVVRNPWARLLSVYKFLNFGSEIRHPSQLPELSHFRRLNVVSFEDFVEKLYGNFKIKGEVLMDFNETHLSNHNQLVMNQYNFIYDDEGNKLVNYVGYLNKLEEAVEDIFNMTNMRMPLPKIKNVSKTGRSTIHMSDKCVGTIGEMYQKDITQFNFKYL